MQSHKIEQSEVTACDAIDSDDKLAILLSLLGENKAHALCSEFGGSSIYIPKADTLNRELRNKKIISDYKAGASFHQLRKKYQLSETTLRNIIFK